MRTGHRISLLKGRIDYKQLKRVNTKVARKAIFEYLKTNNHNISARHHVLPLLCFGDGGVSVPSAIHTLLLPSNDEEYNYKNNNQRDKNPGQYW